MDNEGVEGEDLKGEGVEGKRVEDEVWRVRAVVCKPQLVS